MEDWKKAPQDTVVCESCNMTKRDVVKALASGAETVEEVIAAASGQGDRCDCKEDVQAIIDAYLPSIKSMKSGCCCKGDCC